MVKWRDQMRAGEPFFEGEEKSVCSRDVSNLFLSECFVCTRLALWMGEMLLLPPARTAPAPHVDMPKTILPDFEEARAIVSMSPRGAAALLRLSIQKLCQVLGETGTDLNADIGTLVAKGLPVQIQQALDTVRVIGNESVHPGELDLKDDIDTAHRMFGLVNMIVDDRITRPKLLADLYNALPKKKLDGIAQRDKQAPK
jgi:hypothetical protein